MKKTTAEKFERKQKKVETEQQAIKDEYANRQNIISEDAEEEFSQLKDKIEREMQQEWEGEKRKYEQELQETHEGQGAIIQQIEESKVQV